MKKINAFILLLGINISIFAQTFTDPRDGQQYQTIQAGTATWMAQNLNFNEPGSLCYDDKEKNCEKYGRLYSIKMIENVCPAGWHLPTIPDVEQFLSAVIGKPVKKGKDGSMATYLKEIKNLEALNIQYGGYNAMFLGSTDAKKMVYLWTAFPVMKNNQKNYVKINITKEFILVSMDATDIATECYIRCVKNE